MSKKIPKKTQSKKRKRIVRLTDDLGFTTPRKSMSINVNGKGKLNESDLAKWFTKWRGLTYKRVPMSGASATLKLMKITGDIICTEYTERVFSIETKWYKDLGLTTKSDFKNKKILNFWYQALTDSRTSGLPPLLALRDNKTKGRWLIFLNSPVNNVPIRYRITNTGIPIAYGYWSSELTERFPTFDEFLINL